MASSSSNHHPKSSVATGYPAGSANGIDPTPSIVASAAASTTYPYYPNPTVFYYNNNPNPNHSYYYQNPNPNRDPFLRRLLFLIISIFLGIGVVIFIGYLILRPKLPTFSLSSLNVTNFNLSSSSSSLSSSFDLSFSVYNPNSKMTVGYDRLLADVSVHGDGAPLASNYLAPFTQTKGNSTALSAKMTAVNVFVDSYAVDAIRSGLGSGVVRLDVGALALARFWSGAWRSRWHDLRVFCEDVEVKFRNGTAGDGAMAGGPRQCRVGI